MGAVMLSACAGNQSAKLDAATPTPEPASEPQHATAMLQVPDDGGHYKIGKPYKIGERWYTPEEDPEYDQVGRASWYGPKFNGRRTANGETFDMAALSAAHPTLPLPSYARVTNLGNGRSIIVRLNDRGPYAHGRVIDVSAKTAEMLDFKHDGSADVRVQFVGLAPSEGDDSWLMSTLQTGDGDAAPSMLAASEGGEQQVASRGPRSILPGLAWSGGEKISAETARRPALALASGYAGAGGSARIAAAFSLFDAAKTLR